MTKSSIVTFVTLLLCSMGIAAANYQVDLEDCRYVLDSSTKKAYVQKFIGPSSRKTVTIPDNIMYIEDGKTYTVNAIGDCAFYETNVVTVNMPTTIKTIGACAFMNCPRFCKGKSLVINEGVTSIGMEAFSGGLMTSVELPSSLTLLGEAAFRDSKVKTVTFAKLKNDLKIGDFAFENCTALTSIAIPSKTTSLGYGAFSGCTLLASASIPATVTKIQSRCFEHCKALSSFAIPSGVTTLGDCVFMSCTALSSVSIPNTVKKMGQQVFQNCGLTSVTLPGSITTIPWCTFQGCDKLTTVNLPATLKSIESGAFFECPSLMNIRCDATTPPDCNDEAVFSQESYVGAKLILPAASLAAYSKAEIWKKFQWWLTSGIESPEVDEAAAAEYYTIDGVATSAGKLRSGKLYIRRQGASSSVVRIP